MWAMPGGRGGQRLCSAIARHRGALGEISRVPCVLAGVPGVPPGLLPVPLAPAAAAAVATHALAAMGLPAPLATLPSVRALQLHHVVSGAGNVRGAWDWVDLEWASGAPCKTQLLLKPAPSTCPHREGPAAWARAAPQGFSWIRQQPAGWLACLPP